MAYLGKRLVAGCVNTQIRIETMGQSPKEHTLETQVIPFVSQPRPLCTGVLDKYRVGRVIRPIDVVMLLPLIVPLVVAILLGLLGWFVAWLATVATMVMTIVCRDLVRGLCRRNRRALDRQPAG